MQVSLNWLNDYVNIADLTAAEVAAALTDAGLEVEGIKGGSSVPAEVVVGKVLDAVPHPNADSLRLCTVDVGAAEKLRIVCGAPNARAGIHVAVATIGAVLPGDFKIKKSKIRGEESQGMLCSERELGLSEEHEGIIELKPDQIKPLGTPAAKALGLEDIALEVNVTPNRGDCLGYLGLARDLAAKLGRQLKEPQIEAARSGSLATEGVVQVKIQDAELCPRFVALHVKGLKTAPSPRWMQKRLESAGMRPINALVDATNYVMLEYGQPVHAYDLRDIRGGVIEVRGACEGETLVTLDGQTRQLEAGDILICDGQGPIGLAGIMGGQSSEVKADTQDVVIEVACFAAGRVRKTARRLALHTEASHRFERGIDVDALQRVALRVADLMAQAVTAAGGRPQIAGDQIDAYPAEISKRVVTLRVSHARTFLGLPQLRKDEIVNALTALQFDMIDGNDERLVFEIPFWRGDVEREVDLVEEVGRIIGFDKIPYQLPVMNIRPTPEDGFIDFQEQARVALATAGFRETITFPFVSAAEMQTLGVGAGHPLNPSLSLANPISEHFALMQTTLVPGLIRSVAQNRRHGVHGARLFECGRGYFDFTKAPEGLAKSQTWRMLSRPGRHLARRAREDKGRPVERHWIAAIIDQPWAAKAWNAAETPASFYHGKAAVAALLGAFGVDANSGSGVQFARIDTGDLPFLHPGAAATVMAGNRAVGFVGELHPGVALELGLDQAPIVLELDLEALYDLKGKALKLDTELRRFPPVTRDLAFLVDKARTHQDFAQAIQGFKAKKHLQRFDLFDVYEGGNLPEGKKSLAYGFTFQSGERTLTDQDVESEVTALVAHLGAAIGVTQR